MVSNETSAVHVPIAHSCAAGSPGSDRGVQSRHAISEPSPSVVVATSRISSPDEPDDPSICMASSELEPAAPTLSEYSAPPVVATSTCVLLAAATETAALIHRRDICRQGARSLVDRRGHDHGSLGPSHRLFQSLSS